MIALEDVIRPSQKNLFSKLKKLYEGNTTVCEGKFLLVRGEVPVLLVAHLDTVHHERVKTICYSRDGTILMSPEGIGGDDRCGVYALVKSYEQAKRKPWLLFTCDEETGAAGARAFAKSYGEGKLPKELADIKCIMELDRRGRRDAVYYDCDNLDFEAYISGKGFRTDMGTFSDISLIAPDMGVAAVNLSSGYYNAHTKHEFINRSQLEAVIEKVRGIIEETSSEDFPRYEYVEQERVYYVPHDVPRKYMDLYNRLLEYCYPDEIEEYRLAYGDEVLYLLYEHVVGKPYGGLRGSGGKGCGANERIGSNSEISPAAPDDGRNDRPGRAGKIPSSARSEKEMEDRAYAIQLCK